MVEGAGNAHNRGDGQSVIDDIGTFFPCPDREDHRLWRVDDSVELLDAHHAHVGNGRSAALIFMRLQLAILGPARKFSDFGRDFGQRLVCSIRHNGRNQSSRHGYRNANIGTGVLQHIVAREADIALRHLHERKAERLDQHVVDRQLDTARLQRCVQFAAQLQ